jgi:hypothetical protein
VNAKGHAAPFVRTVAVFATFLAASSASAVPMYFQGQSSDGHAVSAIADFILNDATDTISVTLRNTTATTHDSGELFTGLDFTVSGLTPTLSSASGVQRTVDSSGAFVDTGSPQSLSWSVVGLGSGVHQINFNPNAKDAIIGPPTAGSYAAANGSIKGNAGHNPFAAEVATFELSVPGLAPNSAVDLKVFRFGTTLAPATGTITPLPEPATLALAAAGLVATTMLRRRQKAADGAR